MSLGGYMTQPEANTEIVSAYSSTQQNIPAVVSAPGWFTFAEFFLGKTVACRLEIIAAVSDAALVGTCRFYDPVADDPVAGSDVSFSELATQRYLSSKVTLTGNQRYMIQCQCVGATGVDKFATVPTANLGSV